MSKHKGGLTTWFKEEWVDVKTGKPCGRPINPRQYMPGTRA